MNGSGINFFYDKLDLNTDSFKVFYDFNQQVGDHIPSIELGDPLFSGEIIGSTGFLSEGSGFFDRRQGTRIKISNANQLNSDSLTLIFSQKISGDYDDVAVVHGAGLTRFDGEYGRTGTSSDPVYPVARYLKTGTEDIRIANSLNPQHHNIRELSSLENYTETKLPFLGLWQFGDPPLPYSKYPWQAVAYIGGGNDIFEGTSPPPYPFVYQKRSSHGGILFSNLQGDVIKSGFAVGINDSNRLFFESYNNNGPIVFTSNTVISDKNALAVTLSTNNLAFSYYDYNTRQLERESFSLNTEFVLPSNDWYLGGSDYTSGIGLPNYHGFLDGFLYLSESLSESNLERLLSGLYTYPVIEPAVTGQIQGTITGFDVQVVQVPFLSGYLNSGVSVLEQGQPSPLYGYNETTGTVGSGEFLIGKLLDRFSVEYFCQDSNSDIFEYIQTSVGSTGVIDIERIITGFNYTNQTESIVYTSTPVSGLKDEYIVTPLYSDPEIIEIEPAKTGLFVDENVLNSYGMKSVTYLGKREFSGRQRLKIDRTALSLAQNINSVQNKNMEIPYDRTAGRFKLNQAFPSGSFSLYINGVLQFPSGYTESGNIYDLQRILEGDYFASGLEIVSNQFYDTNDYALVDFHNQKVLNSDLIIKRITGGESMESSTLGLRMLYLNGQRVSGFLSQTTTDGPIEINVESGFSGIDGYFLADIDPSGYTTFEIWHSGYDYRIPYEKPDTLARGVNAYYLNGIRARKSDFIEHGSIDGLSRLKLADYVIPENKENLFLNLEL